ncbi:hypothetical protein F2Q70_00001949 [Brassica cretica]|uniref:Uncharacterized protein n=1 Tax=Brassica cretica TaxID=69181 RepID=A0A8S9INU5_BRACR|nr:hypothetical protein F2Q70_00001949 [Brassica cretica]
MSFHPVNRSLWLNVNNEWKKSSLCMFYSPIPSHYFSKKAPVRSPVTNENSMSKRFFKWLFPPPPARRIIMRRHGSVKRKGAAWVWIRSGGSPRVSLESTSLITTAIATEDVKRKVKILKTLSGHDNLLISMKHMIRIIMMSILRWKAEVHRGGCKYCYHTNIECGCILLSPRCCTSISPTSGGPHQMPTHQFRSWPVDTCPPVLDAAFHLNGNRSGLALEHFAILGLKTYPDVSNTSISEKANHLGSPSSAYLNRQWRPILPITGCINSLQLTTFVTPSTYSKDDSSFNASFLYSPIPSHYFSKKAPARSPVTNENSMSKRFFKLLFPPPPPARRIIMRRHGSVKRKGAAWVWIRSGDSPRVSLEIMRSVRLFVKREVKILKTLSGHDNLLISMKHMRIIMMSILRWKILDRILSSFKRRKYTEEDAKTVIIQILNVVAFCYLLGVVHR